MSSNIGAPAKAKYGEYLDAKNIDDRISLLQEFISLIPKHKGTEKIVALNRSRLAKLKQEKEDTERRLKKIVSGGEDPFSIQREKDFVQVIMVSDFFGDEMGAGKSTLLQSLTGLSNVKPGVLTIEPKIGIYEWKNIKFQLIEMPSLQEWQKLPRTISVLRTTDIVIPVIDLSRDVRKQFDNIISILENANIYLNFEKPEFDINKTGSDGIKIFFRSKEAEESEHLSEFIEEMIRENGIKNAIVKIYDKLSVQKVEMVFNRSSVFKPAIIVGSKGDDENSKFQYQQLKKRIDEEEERTFEILPSAINWDEQGKKYQKGLNDFGLKFLQMLDLIRVFTKSKKGVTNIPLIIHRNANVGDIAKKIHKDFYHHFQYANVFRSIDEDKEERRKYRVGLDFEIEEFDIIEIISDL